MLLKAKCFRWNLKGSGILNSDYSKLKILTPKQMLQSLPIALAQVKAGTNSEILLNEVRQIVYSLHHSKQITKKLYNNIIKSIQWNYKWWILYLWTLKIVKHLSHTV